MGTLISRRSLKGPSLGLWTVPAMDVMRGALHHLETVEENRVWAPRTPRGWRERGGKMVFSDCGSWESTSPCVSPASDFLRCMVLTGLALR